MACAALGAGWGGRERCGEPYLTAGSPPPTPSTGPYTPFRRASATVGISEWLPTATSSGAANSAGLQDAQLRNPFENLGSPDLNFLGRGLGESQPPTEALGAGFSFPLQSPRGWGREAPDCLSKELAVTNLLLSLSSLSLSWECQAQGVWVGAPLQGARLHLKPDPAFMGSCVPRAGSFVFFSPFKPSTLSLFGLPLPPKGGWGAGYWALCGGFLM